MSRPFFSIIIGTARDSYNTLTAEPDTHYMQRTFQSLAAQTDQDFEVIIIDSIANTRQLAAELTALGPFTFPWQVIPNDSWWLTVGLWSLQHAFNLGAVASRGTALLFCGDCFSLPPDTLARSRFLLDQGKCPHLLCWKRTAGLLMNPTEQPPTPFLHNDTTFSTIEPLDALGLYTPGRIYGDTRFAEPMLQANGVILPEHASWQWFYGYGFINRSDFFSVNGWSELYDGDKALGDVELGSRLEMCGRLHFYMDRTLVVYEENHNKISIESKFPTIKYAIRSNYDLIWLHRIHCITRAHTTHWPDSELWRVVRALISGFHCWPHRYEIPDELRSITERWIANQPIFQLEDHCAGT